MKAIRYKVIFLFVLVIAVIFYFCSIHIIPSQKDIETKNQLDERPIETRPESGEIEFNR